MSAPVSQQVAARLPETGSRDWWLLYLGGPLVAISAVLLAFPDLVYDRFIWKYLWGPVVADAMNGPATHDGIRVVRGYNPVNTVTYLALVLYSLPGLQAYLRALDVSFDARLAYGFAPLIIAGGAMRALEDIGLLGEFAVLFITPTIYLVVAGVASLSLGLGALLRDSGILSIPKTIGFVGSLWTVGAVGWAISYGVTEASTVRLWVPLATTGIALGVTGLYYGASIVADRPKFRHSMYLLAVFGQMWDAAQNLVGVTFLGYSPKMFITKAVYQATGFAGSTFVLKAVAIGAIVWFLVDAEDEMDHRWWWLMTFFIIAIGLPMGVRGSLRMMLGV